MRRPVDFRLGGVANALARTALLLLSCGCFCPSSKAQAGNDASSSATVSSPEHASAARAASQTADTCDSRVSGPSGGNDPCVQSGTTDHPEFLHRQNAVGALDGSGVLAFDDHVRSKLGMAYGSLGGYDTALLNKPGLHSAFFGGQVVLAALVNRPRWLMLLQDGFSVVDYTAAGQSLDALNRTSVAIQGDLDRRWSWDADAFASYGSDALRAMAPGQQRVIGSTNVPVPNAAGYGLNAGNVFAGEGAAHLHNQVSERSGWDFSLKNDYQQYFNTTTTIDSAQVRARYLHLATRALTYGVYGLATQQSGWTNCSSGGGGLELAYRPSRHVGLEGSAGPAFGSDSCGRPLQLIANGTAYYRPTEQTALYATATRVPNNGVLPDAVWLTTYAGGLRHSLTPRIDIGADYADTTGSATRKTPSYREDFVSAKVRFSLWGSLSEDVSLQHFFSSGLGANPDRTTLLVGVWWTLARGSREVSNPRP